ncbi:hypothetical protein [Zooshikella harenae]|uniref:hypothetical protein n=1 Tax=Zooshikella harenae TaxID=2827238 RepID=UPI0035A0DF93
MANAPKIMEQIEFTKNMLSTKKVHVTSGLKNENHKEIIEAFNKGLNTIKEDSTFDKILKEHNIK